MRKHLLLPALLLLAAAYGCSETPVHASVDDSQPVMDEAPTDSTGRGGNVMGSGH